MQVCTSLQADNHARTPPLSFFTGRMPFLLPNQQRQSTEGTMEYKKSRQNATRVIFSAKEKKQKECANDLNDSEVLKKM